MIVTNILNQMLRGMFYVLAAYYARGRFLSAVRQSAPSGTSHRGFVPRPGLRLLVTGSIHYTIKIASAVSRSRGANPRSFTLKSTGPNTAPGFTRVWHSNRLPHHPTPHPNQTAGDVPHHPLSLDGRGLG